MSKSIFSTVILGALLSLSAACRPVHDAKRPYEVYPQDETYFKALVNKSSVPVEQVLVLHEDQYPIRLKLSDNGRFDYTLKKTR